MSSYNNTNTSYAYDAPQQPQQAYGGYQSGATGGHGGSGGADDVTFFNDIAQINSSLDEYLVLVGQVQQNQKRLLNEVNDQEAYRIKTSLDGLISKTASLQQDIKQQLQQALNKAGADVAKQAQVESAKENFLQAIQKYRSVEADAKSKTKEQAIRQYQVVQPNASDAEAAAAIDDVGGQQIFSQALLNSNIKGQAQSALNEVKERHRQILQLEESMRQLAELFTEVEGLVAEQDVQVEQITQNIESAKVNIDEAVKQEDEALVKAKSSRKKKCWCLWIMVVVAIIVIIAVVIPLVKTFAPK